MFVNKRARTNASLSSNTKISKKRGAFPAAVEGSFPAQFDYEPEEEQNTKSPITKKLYYGKRGLKRLCCFTSDDRAAVYPSSTLAKKRRHQVHDDSCAPLLEAVDNYWKFTHLFSYIVCSTKHAKEIHQHEKWGIQDLTNVVTYNNTVENESNNL